MAKKKSADEVDATADELISDIETDRKKLSSFFDKLLAFEDAPMLAEQVAKIADALTKQNHLRADVLKTRIKNGKGAQQDDPIADFGQPFKFEENEN